MNLNQTIDFHCARKLEDRLKFRGLDISIETDKGSTRKGVDPNGKAWAVTMNYPYGYIRGTEGNDGDHVDCYVGPSLDAPNVYIVHQNFPDTGKYDEDKCMLGFDSARDAKAAYLAHHSEGKKAFGSMVEMTFDEFKEKVLKTKEKPGMVGMAAPEFLQFMEPLPSYHPPSLTDPQYVPVDDPTETDDRFLDVTQRNSPQVEEFRRKLSEKRARPEQIRHGHPYDPAFQHWE